MRIELVEAIAGGASNVANLFIGARQRKTIINKGEGSTQGDLV